MSKKKKSTREHLKYNAREVLLEATNAERIFRNLSHLSKSFARGERLCNQMHVRIHSGVITGGVYVLVKVLKTGWLWHQVLAPSLWSCFLLLIFLFFSFFIKEPLADVGASFL